MKMGTLLLLVILIPAAHAADFLEDFEDDTVGANPESDFYTYSETNDVGYVTDASPIAGLNSFKVEGSGDSIFTFAAGAQISYLNFTLHAITIDDDGVGGRQVIKIQSTTPVRTMVEFHVLCDDDTNDTGCDFNVRYENIDGDGLTLIDAASADQDFFVEVFPDWSDGTYELQVDGVPDGTFPFLEQPQNIGRMQIQKPSGVKSMNLVIDDFGVEDASDTTVSDQGDIVAGIRQWAVDIQFTNPTSQFFLGLVFFAIIALAVLIPAVKIGHDNTLIPPATFFLVLTTLFLVIVGWWPDWIGIALIILVASLISFVVRSLLMGIRDASTDVGIVAGSLGYFIIATSLLGFSGYASETIQVPTSVLETPEDVDAQTNMSAPQQSWAGTIAECAVTLFSDCSRDTTSQVWSTFTDIASTLFNFARTAFTFLFQLLTFSLPIPPVFNAMIVLPPAAALATVGFKFITRSG